MPRCLRAWALNLRNKIDLRTEFSRAAASYDAAAALARETGRRLGERLDYTKLTPARVADVGCATGDGARALANRYPGAQVAAIDFAYPMLAATRSRIPRLARWRNRGPLPIQADVRQLPLAAGALDLVWSNLMLHWLDDPRPAIAELHRVLAVGGLLTFAVLGPDTAREWRGVLGPNYSRGDTAPKFLDMHDWGDMLVQAGFGDPVMDRDDIVLTYGNARQMLAEQRQLGVRNALFGPVPWREARQALRRWPRDTDGRWPLSFEVVFGQAWKAPPQKPREGAAIVQWMKQPPR